MKRQLRGDVGVPGTRCRHVPGWLGIALAVLTVAILGPGHAWAQG